MLLGLWVPSAFPLAPAAPPAPGMALLPGLTEGRARLPQVKSCAEASCGVEMSRTG